MDEVKRFVGIDVAKAALGSVHRVWRSGFFSG